jgi:hypothetical protein
MGLIPIPIETLLDGRRPPSEMRAREWCSQLEAGEILYFPQTPIALNADDLQFLLGQQQTDSSLHKNIAYKPAIDALSGVDTKTADAAAVGRLQLRSFSATFWSPINDVGSWIMRASVRRRSRAATWPCGSGTTCCIPMHFRRDPRTELVSSGSSTTSIRREHGIGWLASRFRRW